MVGQSEKKGKVIVVSGPSGVGKSTICKEVVNRLSDVQLSVSVTTRTKSESETDGKDYWFITREDFQKRIRQDLLLEYAEVFGNMYGTPRDKIDEAIKAGKSVILEIDVQGGKQAKDIYRDAVMIFILPPSQKELKQRMDGRGRENVEIAEERLNGASEEIAVAWQYYHHMVINDDLETAIKEVVEIIKNNTGEE
ncbi:MAG: guanylate kinase [Planctomycetes bacterium]|nr:guanylate kinase [Planctomycetota bacterium]